MDARFVDMVREAATYLGDMIYEDCRWKWCNQEVSPPKARGVYFLVSEEGVEKVGSARGRRGIRGRLADYCRGKSSRDAMDSTDRLWNRVMVEGELDGRRLHVYCVEVPVRVEEVVTALGRLVVEFAPVLDVEAYYFVAAKRSGEPMRLSGGAA